MNQNLILKDQPLAAHSSWRVGGSADFYASPQNKEELKEVYLWGLSQKLPITILGGGSNVLISDSGVRGLVIHLSKMQKFSTTEDARFFYFHAEAGVKKSQLLKFLLAKKLSHAEFIAGIPGELSGGVVMNAGVGENLKPKEFCEITESIEVLKPTGEFKTYQLSDLKFSYRKSAGWQPGIISSMNFFFDKAPDEKILEKVKLANRRRSERQPLEYPSCGSTFTNPSNQDLKAGQLVEKSGLKGFRIGDAIVSEKHANFILNLGKASATDIHQVIKVVQEKVFDIYGIHLESEVVYLGEWS